MGIDTTRKKSGRHVQFTPWWLRVKFLQPSLFIVLSFSIFQEAVLGGVTTRLSLDLFLIIFICV